MTRSLSFEDGEWYHCYARGVDKRKIFLTNKDYERFLMLLYTCNSDTPVHISNLTRSSNQGDTLLTVLNTQKGEPLVDIGVYSLMPNHHHLLLRQNRVGGVSTFMRKLATGYTMYFNIKNDRTGALFSGTFKANHVGTDQYFKRVCHYIHANAAELQEPEWKKGIVKDMRKLKKFLLQYRFSSLPDYSENGRPELKLVNKEMVLSILDNQPDVDELVKDAQDFLGNDQGDTLII